MASTQRNPAGVLPLVSVVIPLYNAAADLDGLLHCLALQDYPIDRVEYLLVDNASRDRTAALLQAAAQQSHLRLLSQPQIQSSYAARNVGIQAASGEIIAFTDADCRPKSNWLSRLVAPFVDRTVGLVAGEVTALPGRTILEQFADRQAFLSQRHTLAHSHPYGQTANLAVRRSIFEQIGLFRPYLTTGGDADFCWRVQQQTDWRLTFAPDAIVQHRHRSRLPELRQQWQRYGQSNRYLHELHGVALAPELNALDYLYRCSRWLVKEMPIALVQQQWTTLLDTPLHLVCVQARLHGQQRSQLPPKADWIEPFAKPLLTCGTRRSKPPD
ncbi:glycosyltransferase [Microcoleus sp. FACHB-1515]|uniref:glycosyltransferase n=1 Tax=Cyanophyceae TaxID=3028117 RepID=UPI0016831F9B|nr:glycosyltransferase [Microcoleus sp. FACHB-1515]MBD2091772.1 glycosyltransferase [Microcoleus sp. FACHB-1515]